MRRSPIDIQRQMGHSTRHMTNEYASLIINHLKEKLKIARLLYLLCFSGRLSDGDIYRRTVYRFHGNSLGISIAAQLCILDIREIIVSSLAAIGLA